MARSQIWDGSEWVSMTGGAGDAGGGGDDSTYLRLDSANNPAAPSNYLRQIDGDARYLKLSGGIITGTLDVNGGGTIGPDGAFQALAPSLGQSVGDEVWPMFVTVGDGNDTRLWFGARRYAAGGDHNTSQTIISRRVDSTWGGGLAMDSGGSVILYSQWTTAGPYDGGAYTLQLYSGRAQFSGNVVIKTSALEIQTSRAYPDPHLVLGPGVAAWGGSSSFTVAIGTPGTNAPTQFAMGNSYFRYTDSGSTVQFQIDLGKFRCPGMYSQTTASAANLYVDGFGDVKRSTSSLEVKTNVASLGKIDSKAVIAALEPIQFTSLLEGDDPETVYAGFGAETTIAADGRLAADDDANYDVRGIVAHLVTVVQDLISE